MEGGATDWARGVLVYGWLLGGEAIPVLRGPQSMSTEVFQESSRGSLSKG